MARMKQPTYDDLVSGTLAGKSVLHPVTRTLAALAPGGTYDATPSDGDLRAERNRLTSRLRSVRIITGGEYRIRTIGGRLYVVRLKQEDKAS